MIFLVKYSFRLKKNKNWGANYFQNDRNNFYHKCSCSLQLVVKLLMPSKENLSDDMLFAESRRLIHKTITEILMRVDGTNNIFLQAFQYDTFI